jgi:hypothetical protein
MADAAAAVQSHDRGTTPWKTFLKVHWRAIAAADFFTVEGLTRGCLVRYSEYPVCSRN